MSVERSLHVLLGDATGEEAQLALSLYVWPEDCPDPRVVDAWVRANCTPTPRLNVPERHRVGMRSAIAR